MKMKTFGFTIIFIIVTVISSCTSLTNQSIETNQPKDIEINQSKDIEILSSFERTISNIVEQSKPAVVSVKVIKDELKDNKKIETSGGGSGFIIRNDGYILTNEHVVRGSKKITVRLLDGKTYDARLVGGDQNTDIAVIKIDRRKELPFLKLADSSDVRVGQFAIAIGDPIGYRYTVTAGIVGGKNRCFHEKNNLFQYHQNYIQTDAWINPGSSGGPLLNIEGVVIGINSLNPGEGSTLAIDCGLAKKISQQLINHGSIIRGHLDAEMRSVAQGIKLTNVKQNTTASQCGLKQNDIIVEFDGKKVTGINDFEMTIIECQIGQQYPIKVLRQKQEISLDLTIDEMRPELVGRSIRTESVTWKTIGLATRQWVFGSYQRYAYLNEDDRGIIVEKVKKNSPGVEAKIPRGALITAVNGQKIQDVETLETYLDNEKDISEITLDFISTQGTQKATIKLIN